MLLDCWKPKAFGFGPAGAPRSQPGRSLGNTCGQGQVARKLHDLFQGGFVQMASYPPMSVLPSPFIHVFAVAFQALAAGRCLRLPQSSGRLAYRGPDGVAQLDAHCPDPDIQALAMPSGAGAIPVRVNKNHTGLVRLGLPPVARIGDVSTHLPAPRQAS